MADGPPPGGRRPVRLGIVDDHEVFRIGLRSLLERERVVEVAWDTASPHEAWRLIGAQPVDAVLVDVNLGGPIDGLDTARMLTGRDGGLRVMLMSGLVVDERRMRQARSAGVVGFLPKEMSASDMADAIRALVEPGAEAAVPAGEDPLGHVPLEPLSPREVEVLAQIRLGSTNREIARALRVSTTTVNKHVQNVLRKLGVRNRAEAAIVAVGLFTRVRR